MHLHIKRIHLLSFITNIFSFYINYYINIYTYTINNFNISLGNLYLSKLLANLSYLRYVCIYVFICIYIITSMLSHNLNSTVRNPPTSHL